MSHTILLVPVSNGVGLNSVALGLAYAFTARGSEVTQYRAVSPNHNATLTTPHIDTTQVERMLSQGQRNQLLEELVAQHQKISTNHDVTIVQGLVASPKFSYAARLNIDIANALSAEIILVATPRGQTPSILHEHIQIVANNYGGKQNPQLLGYIINKVDAPTDDTGNARLDLSEALSASQSTFKSFKQFSHGDHTDFKNLGIIPWKMSLAAPRVKDIAEHIQASVINAGEMNTRRVTRISLCARSISRMMQTLKPGTLIITPADRQDIILATAMAALNGVNIAALLLTGDYPVEENILKMCEKALASGLPILTVSSDSFRTAVQLQDLDIKVPNDDVTRLNEVSEHLSRSLNEDWLENYTAGSRREYLSPPAFRHLLVEKAKQAQQRIVLPEGDEPRTIAAAVKATKRGIAQCVLLAKPDHIRLVADNHDIELHPDVLLVDPNDIRVDYIPAMVEKRKHKGITEVIAEEQLQDNVVLGTMMLCEDKVDGLVSGAVHTTANTIRPALQLIKTAPDAPLVSSVFFMCLPKQVLVYGDCAVNPDPNAEALAHIAIQSADSAAIFGIPPRIAMLSYSTGESGQGTDVEKVRQATSLVKKLRPNYEVDGPLQYDAALIESVARKKAPNSPVAGRATVLIFPDLNTGNTTYKAVQRSADILSIGPMLQGLNKPVNDLSRGASIDDIVYTIALTAIQAASKKHPNPLS